MAPFRIGWHTTLLVSAVVLLVLPNGASAFGAGNIPSIAQVEGFNWRHGGQCIRREWSHPHVLRVLLTPGYRY